MWKNYEPKLMSKCQSCVHACGETACSWAKDFAPVEGWIAEPTVISPNQPFRQESYLVYYCPKYERGHSEVEWDDGDIRDLCFNILLQAVEDWKALDYGAIEQRRVNGEYIKAADYIQFFNSRYFKWLVKNCLEFSPGEIRRALRIPIGEECAW